MRTGLFFYLLPRGFFLIKLLYGRSKILKSYFSAIAIFDSWRCKPRRVMDGRGATTESSLSDVASLLSISAAIEQHHLHESIFHLFIENNTDLHNSSLRRSVILSIFAPSKRKYPSCTKARPKPRLYETLPRWFAIVGWLHDFSHCGSLLLLARDAARKSQNTSSVLVATFGGHEFLYVNWSICCAFFYA